MNNKTLRRHLPTANTLMMESTVFTIEEYMAVGVVDRPRCKATGESSSPAKKLTDALAEQSEVMIAMMKRLEAMDVASKVAPLAPMYQEAV